MDIRKIVNAGVAGVTVVLMGYATAIAGGLATSTNKGTRADDPALPLETVKLIFIHHSCGENWLSDWDGGLGLALQANNYYVSDTNYGWGPDAIGDRTDIGHWWDWFIGPNRGTILNALYTEYGDNSYNYTRLDDPDPARENQIIMFKSCYPNSYLGGNPDDPATVGDNPLRGQPAYRDDLGEMNPDLTVGNAKGIYNLLLTYFATRLDKLFIAVTAPPQSENDSDAQRSANARAFNNWLVNDWLTAYPHSNVTVFDFYNVLTSNGGNTTTNDDLQEEGNHHRWWVDAVQHIRTVNNDYSAYASDAWDSHPTAAGNQKASSEFSTLLNVSYNRWKSDTKIDEMDGGFPSDFSLEQNFPNPFNASTMIRFNLPESHHVELKIYDILGKEVETLIEEHMPAGPHEIVWKASNVVSGIYVCRLQAGDRVETRKLILQR